MAQLGRLGTHGGHGTGERVPRSTVHHSVAESQKKNKVSASAAWREARQLVWAHRRRLTIGLALMLVSRLSQLVLPLTSKWIVDEVLAKGRSELLVPIALAAAAATLVTALGASLLLAIFLTPVLARLFMKPQQTKEGRLMQMLSSGYERALHWALQFRPAVTTLFRRWKNRRKPNGPTSRTTISVVPISSPISSPRFRAMPSRSAKS